MKQRRSESGFALLLVLAMASLIAISLYMTLPRVAFETQRDKEQLLIDRGHEYQRGIQLYVRKMKRFPSKIEDLENTNGTRFLRRQYTDPMTGKSEWRIIHAGPGGALLDSKVQKQTDKDKKDQKSVNTFITELQPIGAAPTTDTAVNLATRRRPSDGNLAGNGPEVNNNNGSQIGPLPPDLSQSAPPNSQMPTPPPVVYPPGSYPPGVTPPQPPVGIPGQTNVNGTPQPMPGGFVYTAGAGVIDPATGMPIGPALPGQPFQNRGGQMQAMQPGISPTPTTPGASPNTPATAAQIIGNLLTNPRPGGVNGLSQNASATGQVIGGGIAGVASKAKGEGIKIVNDQTDYEKWEFVYDLSKDTGMTGNAAGNLPNANQNKTSGTQTTGQTTAAGAGTAASPAPVSGKQ